MENCTFGEHPAVLVKLKLLANIAIYWPIPNLAHKSEHRCYFHVLGGEGDIANAISLTHSHRSNQLRNATYNSFNSG